MYFGVYQGNKELNGWINANEIIPKFFHIQGIYLLGINLV